MQLDFCTVDVFTRERFLGNPLAIVRIPAGKDLSYETRLKIAREFNLSETIFVYEQRGEESVDTVRASIFITTQELPFAGLLRIRVSTILVGPNSKCRRRTSYRRPFILPPNESMWRHYNKRSKFSPGYTRRQGAC